jgi:hydroxymethylpyrimidine pyrophosphatase-like HAD family hydrolase
MRNKSLTIAIDFDGTLVENAYPKIGKPVIFAFETLKQLQENGHRLILWTYRHGSELNDAIDFCKARDITFYAINKSFPEEEFDDTQSRKILADIYIDDRNIGGLMEWGEIYRLLVNENGLVNKKPKSRGLLSIFKK